MIKLNKQLRSQTGIIMCAILMLSVVFLSGCNDDTSIPINPTVQESFLSFTNASPNSPVVDIYVGGALAQANIPFLGTMNYGNFIAGNNQITVYPSGTTTTPLIDTVVNLQLNEFYSMFAIDSLQSIRPLILNDDLTVPGSTNCNARFLNLSPNAPSYDVQALGKVQPWFPNYSFGDYSDFRALTAGLYDINVLLQASSTVVQSVNNVALQQGYIYTFFTSGFVGPLGSPPSPTFTVVTNYPFVED